MLKYINFLIFKNIKTSLCIWHSKTVTLFVHQRALEWDCLHWSQCSQLRTRGSFRSRRSVMVLIVILKRTVELCKTKDWVAFCGVKSWKLFKNVWFSSTNPPKYTSVRLLDGRIWRLLTSFLADVLCLYGYYMGVCVCAVFCVRQLKLWKRSCKSFKWMTCSIYSPRVFVWNVAI